MYTVPAGVTFQSTRPRGARLGWEIGLMGTMLFQSTRPRGARLFSLCLMSSAVKFQSTRPRGARLHFDTEEKQARVSIHAPAWGATIGSTPYIKITRFQSTRPRGARR